MPKTKNDLTYSSYLQLDKLLDAQTPQSLVQNDEVHDEMLFITAHQAYEVWFKQILHEFSSIIRLMNQPTIEERLLTTIVSRTHRISKILHLLVEQVSLLETMTPMDFLDFRQYLGSASGFQSLQFRKLECMLGLDRETVKRLSNGLPKPEQEELLALNETPSLFALVEKWLTNMPFLEFEEFNFWQQYQDAIDKLLIQEENFINSHPFISEEEKENKLKTLKNTQEICQNLLDKASFEKWRSAKKFTLSQRALVSALFIFLYRNEPILHLPYTLLSHLMDIDELLTAWRSRHVVMVHRMIGDKIGTGGSSGYAYLRSTLDKTRVYQDLCNLSSFLIPQSALPQLPESLVTVLDFKFGQH